MNATHPAPVHVHRSAPDAAGAWDEISRQAGGRRLAHAGEWFTVIREAYGHEPLYLSAGDAEGGRGVLPAFIVRRPVFGTVVASMPFLDGGGPCSASPAIRDVLAAHLIAAARDMGADAVELRCTDKIGIAATPFEHKVNLVLALPDSADRLWQQVDRSVRNQIRKAERSGLSVDIGGAEALGDFYAIFATRMRDLGSPVHARRFFSAAFAAFGSRARLVIVRKGATPVGGLVALACHDTLTVPWASCLQPYFALCPNMLLYWATIRAACLEGFRQFDFGRSSRGSGTYRFKRQWGAEETPLFWYTIPTDPRRAQDRPGPYARASLLTESWRRLPLAITRRLGPHIRKYLTQ